MTYRGPWNAAGMRHRQTPRAYKPCKPVGDYLHVNAHQSELDIRNDIGDCVSCPGCGHLLCSCQKPLAYEPPVYASGGLTPKQWLGKKAKAVEVQADMQPESPVYNSVLEAMKAWRDRMPSTDQKRFDELMSQSGRLTYKPLSPAYLDGIDEALERASGSASSGLAGKDQDRKSDLTQSMGVSADSGKHVSKSALPEEVMKKRPPC